MQWEGLGKFATRSCIAKKQIDSSATACLSGEVHLQNTCNFVKPWHGDRGTAMQNNDYIRLYFANAGDQFIFDLPAYSDGFGQILRSRKSLADLRR